MDGLFGRKRRRHEELITKLLDGVLDAAGEQELADAARADSALAQQIAELQGVTKLLRAQPDAPAPRSFALPYAPRQAPADSRGVLRWTQAATATAAIALVALISADIAGLGRGPGGLGGLSGAPDAEAGHAVPAGAPAEGTGPAVAPGPEAELGEAMAPTPTPEPRTSAQYYAPALEPTGTPAPRTTPVDEPAAPTAMPRPALAPEPTATPAPRSAATDDKQASVFSGLPVPRGAESEMFPSEAQVLARTPAPSLAFDAVTEMPTPTLAPKPTSTLTPAVAAATTTPRPTPEPRPTTTPVLAAVPVTADPPIESISAAGAAEAVELETLGGDGAPDGLSALRWAQLTLGLATAILAIGVVALRRRATRSGL